MATCQLPDEMLGATAFEDTLYNVVEKTIYHEDWDGEDKMLTRSLRDEFPFRLFQVWVFRDDDTGVVNYSIVDSGDPLTQADLREYLRFKASAELDELVRRAPGKTFVGGTRLLVQEWPRKWDPDGGQHPVDTSSEVDAEDIHVSSESFVNWLTPRQTHMTENDRVIVKGFLPFSRLTLQRLTNAFHLPKGYALDLLGEIGIPMRLSWIDSTVKDSKTAADTYMGIVIQSPKYDDERCFISSALSYDPKYNVTSGFFGYVNSRPSKDDAVDGRQPKEDIPSMHEILELLRSEQFAPETSHPMLLPTLLLRHIYGANVERLESARNTLHSIEGQIRAKETLLASGQGLSNSDMISKDDIPDNFAIEGSYSDLNRDLVKHHTTLMNEGFSFSQTLLANSLYGLSAVRKMRKVKRRNIRARGQEMNRIDERELETFLLQLKGYITSYAMRRKRLLSRIDVAFHELFNVTQFLLQQSDVGYSHRTAGTAEKYNRVIMGFSVMSAFFLPASSIATIFGMVEFFEVDKANDKELNVSPAWIVYWKVTIPLTVALIVVLFGWFNLQSVRRRVPPPGPLPAALQGLFSRSPPDEYSVDDEEKRLSSLGSLDYDLGGKSYLIERYGGHLPISQQNSGEGRLSSVSTAGYKGFFGSFFAKLISGEFFNAGFKRKPVPPLARVRPSMRERSRS